MSILFEPIEIHGMKLKNRFVRSATYEACATERGEITDRTINLYSELAQGGAGLIITGFAYVHGTGQTFFPQTAIDRDDLVPLLKKLTDKVHECDTKIAMQITHCGRKSPALRARGEVPLAPSFIENDPYFTEPHRQMTGSEIEEIIDAFARAAYRAKEAGFDAVQLHGAHSYLFSQFLSPHSNRRNDRWGGSLESRMRFHLEVTGAIRKKVGDDFPLLIKLGVQDSVEDGLTIEDGCKVAEKLSTSGIDAIEVSEGLEKLAANHQRKGIKPGEGEAYYAPWSREVKKSVSMPVILVGGLRSFDTMERIVGEGVADCVSMCRPFIREPDLVCRWQAEHLEPSGCISCNLCSKQAARSGRLECAREQKTSEPRRLE